MNFKYEMSLFKISKMLSNLNIADLILLLKRSKDIIGLTFLFVSLFFTNKFLQKDKHKRKFDSIKDISSGRIYVIEGKVNQN